MIIRARTIQLRTQLRRTRVTLHFLTLFIKSGIRTEVTHTAVPTRQTGSRTFPGFRPIYPRGSDANCTKPHRSVHLYRPGTLLEQGAGCCISDTKIQGRVAISSHPLTHAKPAADFQHGESKAIQSHLRFRMIRLRKERFSHRLRKQFIHFRR